MDAPDPTTRVRAMLVDTAGADGTTIGAADGLLQTYHGDPTINWQGLHAEAAARGDGVAPVGPPYWTLGRPSSVLAFWGADGRSRIAADPATPSPLLSLMAADPDPRVRQWASARGGAPSTAALPPIAPGVAPKRGSRWLPAVLAAVVTALAACLVGAGLWSAGVNNGYATTVVDQQAREATSREALTGQYELKELKRRICGNNKDYLSCVNMHVTLYNAVCLNTKLTGAASATCHDLSTFIDTTKVRYKKCGTGCKTRADADGKWGWPYLQAVPVVETVSNDDALPEISHVERCEFVLGAVKLGTCPR